MFILNRVTFSYSPEEDRISLTGQSRSGENLRLWLTSRLVRQLIPHLLGLTPNAEIIADIEATNGELIEDSGNGLTGPASAVDWQPGCQEFLISAIDLTVRETNLILTFRGEGSHDSAVLGLNHESSYQTVEALRVCSAKAGWEFPPEKSEPDRSELFSEKVTIH